MWLHAPHECRPVSNTVSAPFKCWQDYEQEDYDDGNAEFSPPAPNRTLRSARAFTLPPSAALGLNDEEMEMAELMDMGIVDSSPAVQDVAEDGTGTDIGEEEGGEAEDAEMAELLVGAEVADTREEDLLSSGSGLESLSEDGPPREESGRGDAEYEQSLAAAVRALEKQLVQAPRPIFAPCPCPPPHPPPSSPSPCRSEAVRTDGPQQCS